MKVLLSNRDLRLIGGSEVWVRTMYLALLQLGHEVDVYSARANTLWPDMPRIGRLGSYDVGIMNHKSTMKLPVLRACKTVIHTRHGVIPMPEKPPPTADIYVSVSEETQAASLADEGISSVIIRNPIDTDFFAPEELKHSLDVRTIMVVSNNQSQHVLPLMQEAFPQAHVYGVGRTYGNTVASPSEMRRRYREADLVVTLGRGCYEALACGTPVLPIDWSGGDELITVDNFRDIRTCNCSGRFGANTWTADEIVKMVESYEPAPQELREFIVTEHHSTLVANQYLDLVR